jgi:hypothetical protein
MKREHNLLIKEKENMERDAARNYNLYKKAKDENVQLHKIVKEMKQENKSLTNQISKIKNFEQKYKNLESENKELRGKLEELMKHDFDILKKLDLDEYNLTSDDLRSERNKKYIKGMEAKGHPLVPKLNFRKIYEWREQQDMDDMQDDDDEEEEEEEDLLTENEKFMPKGSELQSIVSRARREEMEKRKEDVIAILNDTYAEEEQDTAEDGEDIRDDEVLF